MIRRFLADERGATAIEYGLVAGLVTIVVIGAITLVGGGTSALWNMGAAEVIANRASSIP